jgi:hypothetical protein
VIENPLMKSAPSAQGARKKPLAAAQTATKAFAANETTSPKDGLVAPGTDP